MPLHLIQGELAAGTLRASRPVGFNALTSRLPMGVAFLPENNLGPAARWMIEHLASMARDEPRRQVAGHSDAVSTPAPAATAAEQQGERQMDASRSAVR